MVKSDNQTLTYDYMTLPDPSEFCAWWPLCCADTGQHPRRSCKSHILWKHHLAPGPHSKCCSHNCCGTIQMMRGIVHPFLRNYIAISICKTTVNLEESQQGTNTKVSPTNVFLKSWDTNTKYKRCWIKVGEPSMWHTGHDNIHYRNKIRIFQSELTYEVPAGWKILILFLLQMHYCPICGEVCVVPSQVVKCMEYTLFNKIQSVLWWL